MSSQWKLWESLDPCKSNRDEILHQSSPTNPPKQNSSPFFNSNHLGVQMEFNVTRNGSFVNNSTPLRERTVSGSSYSSGCSERCDVPKLPVTKKVGPNYCSLCKTNGEIKEVYSKHSLKRFVNDKCVVECPVLRRLVCRICGATGDDAHTLTHCPRNPAVTSIVKQLKTFRRMC